MHSSILVLGGLLALSTSISAQSSYPLQQRALVSTPRSGLFGLLAARQEICTGSTCPSGDCIPSGYNCCSDGAGCPPGEDCVPNGCCPSGETCDGTGGGTMTLPGALPTDSFNSLTNDPFTDTFTDTDPATLPQPTASYSSDDLAQASAVIASAEFSATATMMTSSTRSSASERLIASSTTTSSPTAQTSPVSGGGSSGGSSSGGSSSGSSGDSGASGGTTSSGAVSAATYETVKVVLSGFIMLAGLAGVQAL